jgi:dipeptidyl aminopeptidase/acylaminoacyl peptidase
MKKRNLSVFVALAASFLLLSSALYAQAPTAKADAKSDKPTIEEIFRQPELSGPALSLDGKSMAATVPYKGRMNLAVIDLETRKANVVSGYNNFDVLGHTWVGNDYLLYSLGQSNSPTGPGQFDGGGLFVVKRDGKDFRRLSLTVRETRAQNQFVYRYLDIFRTIPGNDEEIIATGNMTAADSTDLYRLNIRNGRYTLLTRGRPADRTFRWIMDSKLVPRVVTANVKDKLTEIVYYRKDENSEWYEIARYEGNKGPVFVPLAFESNDQTLQVAFNGERDTMAVYRYDPNAKKMGEMIASHPKYDMGASADGGGTAGVITDPVTDKILGYAVNAAKPERVWIDEKYAAIQRNLDATLPERINSFRRLPDGKRLIVTSYSDTSPVRWYIHDEEKKTIEAIGVSRPWLDGKLVEQRIMTYKTRDGLEIGGYYFLPKDYKPGTKLPTIVHIHGGPFARADSWGNGFGVREGQLFASRGYAVIVPNYRVTPGLGSKIYYAGFGTVGREMSDDHEDALKWGIEQGFVDPAKACMSGASYGGYAALQALVRNNDMWKCAVAGLAVTDYKFQLTSREGDTADNESGVTYWKSVLGATDLNSQLIKDISPVYNASKIRKPVFLYAGQDDIRVPINQINRMESALAAAGNPVKAYVVKPKEGHGFGTLENNVDLYTQVLAFLENHLRK